MRRWLLAVVALTVATAAGCWPQPASLSTDVCGVSGPPDVYLFGDSLSAWAKTPTCAGYAADGLSVSYNAMGGTQLDHWMAAMEVVPDGATVVVELGTNDATNNLLADMLADLRSVLDTLDGTACVVVPTLNTTGGDLRGWPYDVRTRGFNAELARLVGIYPNLRVVPWDAQSAGHPEWLVGATVSPPDWVHYRSGPFAQMLVDAPTAC